MDDIVPVDALLKKKILAFVDIFLQPLVFTRKSYIKALSYTFFLGISQPDCHWSIGMLPGVQIALPRAYLVSCGCVLLEAPSKS